MTGACGGEGAPLTVPSPLVVVSKCQLSFAIRTWGSQLDQNAWKQRLISWCFTGNAPNVVVAGAGRKVNCGVGQWVCVSLPVSCCWCKTWCHVSLGKSCVSENVFGTALNNQEGGLPCHLHYGEEPQLIHMQAAKPRGFQGTGVFSITRCRTGKCLAQNGISAFHAEARPRICDVCHKKSN